MISLNLGLAIPYRDYVSYREWIEMIKADRRPAVILSDKQLQALDEIARNNNSSINNEILKAINYHIHHYHTKKIYVNHENRYIP